MRRCRMECNGSGPIGLPRGRYAPRSLTSRFLTLLAVLLLGSNWSGSAWGADPDLQFLQGLRERRYYDYALLYLDKLEKRPGLKEEVKVVLPYERAITHLRNSETLRNNDARAKELDLAETNLEKFVQANPEHPLAGEADSQRAEILLGRARVEVWQSRAAESAARKEEIQRRARELVSKAGAVFQAAHDRHKTEWDKLPRTPIDPKDVELKEIRDKVETAYLRAQLDLAIVSYEVSQTYDAGSAEYRKQLTQAASEFEKIHEKYRSQVVGLHARMWQGKCFEEQGEIGKALGIYNELLQHPGGSDTMQQLQDRVLQFRLICLNHPQSKDYQLVVQEAGAWLARWKDRAATSVGLGIRWERARAFEQLAGDRNAPEHEREQRLKDALDDARLINRYAGEFKGPSSAMISRLNAALHRDPGGPKDFDGALALARKNVNDIALFNERVAEADDPSKKEELEQDRLRHLEETARLLRLALELAQPSTERKQVHNARYLLAFVQYEMKNSYEAGILADYVARRLKTADAEIAQEAAFLGFASWQQAYFEAPQDTRETELRHLSKAADFLVQTWPESERAATVRMTLGQINDRQKQPLEAVRWYQQIPETSDQYATAQIAAGQAYWTAWLNSAGGSGAETATADDREKWQTSAAELLQSGIKRYQEDLAGGTEEPTALIAAKVSLAQIDVSRGNYAAAIQLLTEEPQAPLKAITVEDEAARPAEGVQGRSFAGLVYQLLLRSYVGNQQIDEALRAMEGLERVAAGSGAEGIAAVYISLGREIQKEIERLEAAQDQSRLTQVRESFDQFLDTLSSRKNETMSYGQLIWIGETYYGLGRGMADQPNVARDYFTKAAETYHEILRRDQADSSFVPTDREPGVKLRLVDCIKREGRYEDAFEMVRSVLKVLPRALDAQFEAASLLQEWGASDPAKYLLAINGTGSDDSQGADGEGTVWGWAQTATRLQRILAAGTKNDEYRDRFAEARYHLAVCRREYGLTRSKGEEKSEALSMALQEIEAFVLISTDISDEWWSKLDNLYQQVQKDLGRTSKPLRKPEVHVAQPAPAVKQPANSNAVAEASSTPRKAGEASAAGPAKVSESSTRAIRKRSSPMLYGAIALILSISVTALFIFVSRRSSRKRRRVNVSAESLAGFEIPRKTRATPRPNAPNPPTRGARKP